MSRNNSRSMWDRIAEYFQQNTNTKLTGVISIHRTLVAFCGDLKLALILQYVVWCDQNISDDRGEWGHSVQQFERMTTLSRYWVYKSLGILIDVGLLQHKGMKKWGKNAKATNTWSLDFNLLLRLMADYLDDPDNKKPLHDPDFGLEDAIDDPDRSNDAHWFTLPSVHENIPPDHSVLDDPDFGKAEKWAAAFRVFDHAPANVIDYSYALFQETGLTPDGLSGSAWVAEIENLIKASKGDRELASTAFRIGWEQTENKAFLARPNAFLRWVRAVVAEKNKLAMLEEQKAQGKRPGIEAEQIPEDMYADVDDWSAMIQETDND